MTKGQAPRKAADVSRLRAGPGGKDLDHSSENGVNLKENSKVEFHIRRFYQNPLR